MVELHEDQDLSLCRRGAGPLALLGQQRVQSSPRRGRAPPCRSCGATFWCGPPSRPGAGPQASGGGEVLRPAEGGGCGTAPHIVTSSVIGGWAASPDGDTTWTVEVPG